jgi:hypothetical protein
MNNSPIITPEEWDRIRKYIADGPAHVHLDENGVVLFDHGMMHPRAYLQIMDDDFDDEPVDILKHTDEGKLKLDDLTMPGSLHGALVMPWKHPKD